MTDRVERSVFFLVPAQGAIIHRSRWKLRSARLAPAQPPREMNRLRTVHHQGQAPAPASRLPQRTGDGNGPGTNPGVDPGIDERTR